MEYFLTQVLGE